MRVEVVSYVRYQDGGRERELMPGQTCELADALARAWAAQGWVRPVTGGRKTSDKAQQEKA